MTNRRDRLTVYAELELKIEYRDFPGGPVVKTLLFH